MRNKKDLLTFNCSFSIWDTAIQSTTYLIWIEPYLDKTLFTYLECKNFSCMYCYFCNLENVILQSALVLAKMWNLNWLMMPSCRLFWQFRSGLGNIRPAGHIRPASYIWSYLNSYIDYENTLNIKKVPVLLQKQS